MARRSSTESSAAQREPALIAGRYRCLRTLGSGGTADVFEALDRAQGRRVALKLLRGDSNGNANAALLTSLFEREFHTLAQLQHPSVVSVLDYGVAAEGRFYTMELLEGSDLASVAPLPWRRACALLRDICSVLALLHSRGLVYRDLSARNVFCSSTGTSKLIDFGALQPMGVADKLVGSPPFLPPEALNRQPLGAQSDLFGVGATLYFALTGQLLFPARCFADLPFAWQLAHCPASTLVAGIPRELDALILDLVQLDPRLRPRSAGEVIDRLEAIAGLERADQLSLSRPYLGTPDLVERETLLDTAQRQLLEARAGRGAALMVTGADGAGRSRLLDACVLQAKLLGMSTLVLRARRGQSAYAGARALADQLLQLEPALARATLGPHLPVLGHALPAVLEEQPVELARFADPRAARAAIQAALRTWLQAVSRERPLAIAVDDIEQLDEPSAALVALLAADARERSLVVLASAGMRFESRSLPLAVLQRSALPLTLLPLSDTGTRRLLASMFGNTPRVALLAARVHAVAGGNPRDIVRLTRTLVDNGTIRWEAGGWALPSSLHADALPASVTEAMCARIRALSAHGLRMARLLALSQLPAFTFQQFLVLCDGDADAVVGGIGELLEAELLCVEANAQQLSHSAWRDLLLADLGEDARVDLHRRLAALLADLPEYPFRHIQHLRWAGEESAALERLVAYCTRSAQQTAADPAQFLELVERLPQDWYELLDWAIERLRATGGSPAAICAVQGRMAGILPTMNPYLGGAHFAQLIRQLRHDSGLDLCEQLAGSGEPPAHAPESVRAVLAAAQQRFDATPEQERVFPPQPALRQLAQILFPAAGVIATTYDYELLRSGPDLTPLHAIAPWLEVVSLLWDGLGERMAGRMEAAIELYERVELLLGRPDRTGVDPSHAIYTRLGVAWGMGMLQASMGQARCLAHAEMLSRDPWYRASGTLVRMLHGYWQADPVEGDAQKERWLLSLIESKARHWFEGVHLVAELSAHALAGDLERLKGVLPDLRNLAELAGGWRPIYDYALGEYDLLRGDLSGALACFTRARTARAGCEHQIWALAAGGELRGLILQEQFASAIQAGEEYQQLARAGGLVHLASYVRIPLARAYAGGGQTGRALSLIDEVIEELERSHVSGLPLGWAYETRAQIALAVRDQALARHSLEACAHHFRAAENPLGRRRCERLVQGLEACSRQQADTWLALEVARVEAVLSECVTSQERASAALGMLLERTGASAGILKLAGWPVSEAAALGLGAQRELAEHVLTELTQALLKGWTAAADLATVTALIDAPPARAGQFTPVILRHGGDRSAVTGVALLLTPSDGRLVEPAVLAAALSRALSDELSADSQVPGM